MVEIARLCLAGEKRRGREDCRQPARQLDEGFSSMIVPVIYRYYCFLKNQRGRKSDAMLFGATQIVESAFTTGPH
ncbi:hypothetical protein [Microbulbifer taiwanensis]|uniref:hypothetical protein n=1 Tax=Microbulbifer taiwanensis TaxID=986746 RepID=UPI00361AE003